MRVAPKVAAWWSLALAVGLTQPSTPGAQQGVGPGRPDGVDRPAAWPTARIGIISSFPTTVDIDFADGLLVTKSALGGGVAEETVIDTAMNYAALTPEAVLREKLITTAPLSLNTIDGPVEARHLPDQTIRLGNVILESVPMVRFDPGVDMTGTVRAKCPGIWLGGSALGALSITIDPVALTLTVARSGGRVRKGAIQVPITLDKGVPYVRVSLTKQVSFRAMVSTGTVGTLIPAAAAAAAKLPVVRTVDVTHRGGRKARVAIATAPTLQIGEAVITDQPVLYPLEAGTSGLPDDVGVLGTDALLRYRVTLDYPARKLILEKPVDKPAAPATKPVTGPDKPPRKPGH